VASSIGARKEDGHLHSPFARTLFTGLEGDCDLALTGKPDGVITASELALYLREKVEVEAAQKAHLEQTPQIWTLNSMPGVSTSSWCRQPLNLPPAEALTEVIIPIAACNPTIKIIKSCSSAVEKRRRFCLNGWESGHSLLCWRLRYRQVEPGQGGLLPRLADVGQGGRFYHHPANRSSCSGAGKYAPE